MTDNLVVHVRHVRAAKLCMSGARSWFAARGWSWTDFVAEGLPAHDLIATGDPFALRSVEEARKESERGHR